MMLRRKTAVLLMLLLACGPTILGAQDTGAPDAGSENPPRRILVFLSIPAESDYSSVESVLIRESLLGSLTAHQERLSVVEWPGEEPPPTDRELTAEAIDLGCDSWLRVTVTGSVDNAGFEAVAFDLVSRKYAMEYERSLSQSLRTRDLDNRFWDEMTGELAGALSVPESGTEITFVGEPGTIIRGAGAATITIREDGRATVTLPNPNVYRYRATRIGFDPLTATLVVGDEPQTVVLQQERAPRHILEAGLSTASFPTASYGYFLLRNYIFAKVGFTSYVAGLYLLSESTEKSIIVSEPLTEFHLQLGSYFTPPDRAVRGYAGAIGGLRFVHSTFLFGPEPIAPFFAGPLVGLDFEPFPEILGFLEWSPLLVFTEEPRLLGSSFPEDYYPMATWNVGIGIVDFLRYRLGVRYQW